jgi:hypothetical protein
MTLRVDMSVRSLALRRDGEFVPLRTARFVPRADW